MSPGVSSLEIISWHGWGVMGSIAVLLVLLITILLWLLPFPASNVPAQLNDEASLADLRARFGAETIFGRYRIAVRRFSDWLSSWFGRRWSAQAFERCLAIAFVFPVALFLMASLLHGYKNGQIGIMAVLSYLGGMILLAALLAWLFRLGYLRVSHIWSRMGGDNDLAETIARIVLGAFAVIFAFAIAFAVASSLAGEFADAWTVVIAIIGGFAFAIAFAVAFAFAGIWAFAIALLLVTGIALTMAKQFAFFLLLFFIILPVINALMDWISWAVTRFLLSWIEKTPQGIAGYLLTGLLVLSNILAALLFVLLLTVLLPVSLEAVDQLLSIFGRDSFDWRSVALQAVEAPWDEGLFVTGMLLTPLVPCIAHLTIGLAAIFAPFTPRASALRGETAGETPGVADHNNPADTQNRLAMIVYISRLWYIPSLAISLGIFAGICGVFYLSQLPVADSLHSLALCSTSWGHGECPWQ